MIAGIGIDQVEVERFDSVSVHFLERVFSPTEIEYASRGAQRSQRLAARFAAKEAFLKALGTGLRNCSWQDLSVVNDDLGAPHYQFSGRLAAYAEWPWMTHLSLSHTAQLATAWCILERADQEDGSC